MAKFVLINAIGGARAGDVYDDAQGQAAIIAGLTSLGGVLVALPNAPIEAAAERARLSYARGAGDEAANAIMIPAYAATQPGPAGPAGPAGHPGPPGPAGPNEILWQQALNVDTGNARSGASGFNASALTTGNLVYVSRETTINGIQFFLPASVGPKTVRASLYNFNTTARVASVDVAATPGVVTATFATPYVISGAGVGGQWAATMYLLDGSGHVFYQQFNGWPVSPGLECIILGPNILWTNLVFSSGDNLDFATAPTLGYAFKYPVDLILG